VYNIDEFESGKGAGRKLKIFNTAISAACSGKTKTAGGFKWMYKEDYDKYIEQQTN